MACMRAQSTPQIPRSPRQARSALARHRNENPNENPQKEPLWGQILSIGPVFFMKIYFVGEPRLPIVLLHLGPTTNRDSAILVVQVPNGTDTQKLLGRACRNGGGSYGNIVLMVI